MASSGDQGESKSKAKNLRVLLQFSGDTLRIPDELAAEIGDQQAFVFRPTGGGKVKVWPVDVGRDGGGAFLGGGEWAEFAKDSGVEDGWLLVLRHHGRGVLTVKAFDDSRCLRELGPPTPPEVEASVSSKDAARKRKFISVLPTNFMEKMLIPAKFVEQYLPKENLNNQSVIVLGPVGKVHSIKLEMGHSDVFFAGGWSQFLAFHDITEANAALLLRYEGNMVFTIKVFGPNGCPRESNHKEVRVPQSIEEQQKAPSASIQKCCKNDLSISDGERKPQGSITSLKKASSRLHCVYEIGPPAWIRKEMSTKSITKLIPLPATFCDAIGFREACTITFKTSLSSTRSWQVRVLPYKANKGKGSSHQVGAGWKRFCQENNLKEGDVCTFNVIDSMLWHVVIARR